jgi:hypothetical protein
MSTWRQIQAAERRQQREAHKRQRELERLAMLQAKQTQEDLDRLEVETYENRLELLLSVHKEQGETWDWACLASSLERPRPEQRHDQEAKARQSLAVSAPHQVPAAEAAVALARSEDDKLFHNAMAGYEEEKANLTKMKELAVRILAGDHKAYITALVEFSPLTEISDLGSALKFTVHSARLIEAALNVNGTQAIPSEIKSLTAAKKKSVKPMPKGRFHELYQDYVCGCVLRVAREVFALLPIETLLITAYVDALDSRTGLNVEQAVLSLVLPRSVVHRLDFDHLNPSDSLENFQHRGDFKASRKTETFLPILPLTPADIPESPRDDESLNELITRSRQIRQDFAARIVQLTPDIPPTTPEATQPL